MVVVDSVVLITGTSGFREMFELRGPFDHEHRSLRAFDLERRLFKYPLSYMIYTESFNALSVPVKKYVYRRIAEVLTGKDQSGEFTLMTPADRAAVIGILKDTRPELMPFLEPPL